MRILNTNKNILVLDTIPYAGGSKVATQAILEPLRLNNISINVVTRDTASWSGVADRQYRFFELPGLAHCESGWGYFARHLLILPFLLTAWFRCGRPSVVVGPSGPGVDLSLYLLKKIFPLSLIQLIHGPVASSKTIARCLTSADLVAYLPSTRASIEKTLARIMPVDVARRYAYKNEWMPMINGLPTRQWPTPIAADFSCARVFWAASLLKWKGLDLLLNALNKFSEPVRPETSVCYIRPKATLLPVSTLPEHISKVHFYESPSHLDKLRSSCNIFVSTSKYEPFGLSILEALAAGMCVVIPKDGAYWDQILEEGVNCVKYNPDDPLDLYYTLQTLSLNMSHAKDIALSGREIADSYCAEITYRPLMDSILCSVEQGGVAKKASFDVSHSSDNHSHREEA